MNDERPHLTLIQGTAADDVPPPATPTAITPPRGMARWKRQSFTEGLIEAYHRLGGIDYLVQFGRDHPADFVRACSRLIPQEIRTDLSGEITIIHSLPRTALDIHEDVEHEPAAQRVFQTTPPTDAD
jgi:hypothetical protein